MTTRWWWIACILTVAACSQAGAAPPDAAATPLADAVVASRVHCDGGRDAESAGDSIPGVAPTALCGMAEATEPCDCKPIAVMSVLHYYVAPLGYVLDASQSRSPCHRSIVGCEWHANGKIYQGCALHVPDDPTAVSVTVTDDLGRKSEGMEYQAENTSNGVEYMCLQGEYFGSMMVDNNSAKRIAELPANALSVRLEARVFASCASGANVPLNLANLSTIFALPDSATKTEIEGAFAGELPVPASEVEYTIVGDSADLNLARLPSTGITIVLGATHQGSEPARVYLSQYFCDEIHVSADLAPGQTWLSTAIVFSPCHGNFAVSYCRNVKNEWLWSSVKPLSQAELCIQ